MNVDRSLEYSLGFWGRNKETRNPCPYSVYVAVPILAVPRSYSRGSINIVSGKCLFKLISK